MKVMYVFKRKFHYFWGKNLIKKKKKSQKSKNRMGYFIYLRLLQLRRRK